MKKLAIKSALLMSLLLNAAPAHALVVGGINFDSNAFADTLQSSSGSFSTSGGALSSVLTDVDAATYAFSFSPGAYVQLGFTDNLVVNGAGNDLALFEVGVPDSFRFSLTIGGFTQTYNSVATGDTAGGFSLNLAQVDLSTFGVAAGATIDSIVIGLDIPASGGTVPSLSLVGAINSRSAGVPDGGATLGLLASSCLALVGLRRRVRG
jgi:VPDSG-CTERM motif